MDKYRPCPTIIAMFTSDSQHPPRSRHAVYLGAYEMRLTTTSEARAFKISSRTELGPSTRHFNRTLGYLPQVAGVSDKASRQMSLYRDVITQAGYSIMETTQPICSLKKSNFEQY